MTRGYVKTILPIMSQQLCRSLPQERPRPYPDNGGQ